MKKTHLNFAGTPLSNEVFVNNKVSITESNPNAQYEYDTGLGIGKFHRTGSHVSGSTRQFFG